MEATRERQDSLLETIAHRKRKHEVLLREIERPASEIALCMIRKRAKICGKRAKIECLEREIAKLEDKRDRMLDECAKLDDERERALDECAEERGAHARALDLWGQVEDLLDCADGSQTCVPIGHAYEVEPFLARMAGACPRDGGAVLCDDDDGVALVNAALDSLKRKGVTVTRATITVVMETPVFDDEHDLDDPCFSFKDIEDSTPYEMERWSAVDAYEGHVLPEVRMLRDDEDRLAACAAKGVAYSGCNLRGARGTPYLKDKVDIEAWVVSVPPLS